MPVQVDGTVLSQGVNYLQSGVTYVPPPGLLDAFGGWSVWWDSAERWSLPPPAPVRHRKPVPKYRDGQRPYIQRQGLCGAWPDLHPPADSGHRPGRRVAWDPQLGGAAVTSPGADHNAMDLYWLSRIISAESRGENMTGQIAVGNVVLNRVAAKEFPNTIPAVIFDRKHDVQFTPVSNGTVYLPPTAKSVEAAKQVLNGENTAGKALYFYAPALSQGTWINANRAYLKTIGRHRFYL